MTEWCNVCREEREWDDLEISPHGNRLCPVCGTRLVTGSPGMDA